MIVSTTRRTVLLGLAATFAPLPVRAANAPSPAAIAAAVERIAGLEHQDGGRLGVAVLDTANGAQLLHRADERFPMCSTFKLLASAAVLAKVDAGTERLDRMISYGPADLLGYAPVAKAHVNDGSMRLGDLCAAAIDWSDNTAANLILAAIGGPAGWTAYVRSLGDQITQLDRTEPTLNTALPNDIRDTTSPLAMIRDVQKVLLGEALSATSRQQLNTWLLDDKVGDKRVRAGVPKTWRVGDKTGTGDNATANAIGILYPPDRSPIVFAVYYTGSTASVDRQNAVHKEVGSIIADVF